LDKVTLCKIVDSVLNEESGSSGDESEDDDISSYTDIEFVVSDGGNEISRAVQIVRVKCSKVTRRRHSVDWKWMENQNMTMYPFDQSVVFQQKLYINGVCFAI
jgi:hypothetical protein